CSPTFRSAPRGWSSDVEDDQALGAARRVGGDLFVLLFPDESAADRRLLRDASTTWVGLRWRDQQVGRFFAIGVANLDLGAEANDAVARRTIFDRLGGGQ